MLTSALTQLAALSLFAALPLTAPLDLPATIQAGSATPVLSNSAAVHAAAKTTPQAHLAASTTAIDSASPTVLGCASTVAVSPYAQTQGGAQVPICARDQWVYDIPASSAPPTVRRTETHWGSATALKQFTEGDTVTYEAEYTGTLGQAAQKDYDWHVIWQLHGPSGASWGPPAMGLNVRNGELRLGGGSGHPLQDWATRNYEYSYRLATWRDNTPVRVKVQTYLSTDPGKGWVSVWIDGKQVLNQVRPASYKGALRPATYYPGLSYVVSRTGLYRGSQSADVPTYRQAVTARVISAG